MVTVTSERNPLIKNHHWYCFVRDGSISVLYNYLQQNNFLTQNAVNKG